MGQGQWLPGQGPSFKLQAGKSSRREHEPVRKSRKPQAPSIKLQASSRKLKSFLNFNPVSRGPWAMAHSYKLLDLVPWNKFQGPLTKGPD